MTSGPIHPTSIHWIIWFGGSVGVLSQAATEVKTVSELQNAFYLIRSALSEKALTVRERQRQASAGNARHVCQPSVNILNI